MSACGAQCRDDFGIPDSHALKKTRPAAIKAEAPLFESAQIKYRGLIENSRFIVEEDSPVFDNTPVLGVKHLFILTNIRRTFQH